MKIKKILTFVFAAALMTSCGNEDGPGGDGGNGGGTEHTEYFGVNMSGAEFGNVYPGVDGTHYGYPTKKDLEYFKEKGLRMIRFPFRWERIQSEMNGPLINYGIGQDERIRASSRGLEHESLARYAQLRSLLRLFQWCEL